MSHDGEIAIGDNCISGSDGGAYSIAIGKNIEATRDNVAIGTDVYAQYTGGSQNYGGTIALGRNIRAGGVCVGYYLRGGFGNQSVLIGNNLTTGDYTLYRDKYAPVYIGRYPEADSFSPSILKIGIGSGFGYTGATPKTVLESDNDGLVRLPHGLCLDSITTSVNAITPPKSSPASVDDQTLVTKSYITSQSINYEPTSEVQLTAVTTYSLGTLIGDPNWSFPYSSGSITLVFTIDQIFHTVHIPIPSYFNTTTHPVIKAPLTDIHNYQITDPGDSGTLKGLLLFYYPATKEISLENPECVNINNVGDSITDAFNYGNIDIWFWGMTCYNHF